MRSVRKAAPFVLAAITVGVFALLVYVLAEGRGGTNFRIALVLLMAILVLGWIFAGLDLRKGKARFGAGNWVEAEASAEVLKPDEEETDEEEKKERKR
jgi:peptidoglycan/LPS O-acetylase OafA/YrhL